MTNKKYILPLVILTVVSWTAFLIVILKIEPCISYSSETFCAATSSLGMILFYLSLFFAFIGSFSIIGFLSRSYIYKQETYASHFNISLRQGILLAICVCVALGLLSLNVLKWWTTILLLTTIILVEFYFLSRTEG